MNSTIGLTPALGGAGVYNHFLRADSATVQAGTGNYVSAELTPPSLLNQATGAATLVVNQCVNGTVTQLGSATVNATNGMSFRTVIFGSSLWVFVNNVLVMTQTVTPTAGDPGVGGYGQRYGSGFLTTQLGHHDTVAPFQVAARTVATSVFPNSVSLRWQGVADDARGIGVFGYNVLRNGTQTKAVEGAEFGDATVQAGTT